LNSALPCLPCVAHRPLVLLITCKMSDEAKISNSDPEAVKLALRVLDILSQRDEARRELEELGLISMRECKRLVEQEDEFRAAIYIKDERIIQLEKILQDKLRQIEAFEAKPDGKEEESLDTLFEKAKQEIIRLELKVQVLERQLEEDYVPKGTGKKRTRNSTWSPTKAENRPKKKAKKAIKKNSKKATE